MKFEELVNIVATLRGPDGCPWDREQTGESLRPFLIEEFYELVDALDENNHENIKEELGDLLFQIVLQSRIFEEDGRFDINDVIENITGKMINRHPHVFGDRDLKTSDDVKAWWKEHKKKEGKNRDSAIGRVLKSLPALLRAQELQIKASEVGFDWEKTEDVFDKLKEETGELKDALEKKKHAEIEDELGDILFVLVRIANSVDVNPEDALRKTINKFIRRFKHMESQVSRNGRKLSNMTLAEMDILWNEAQKSK